MLVGPRIRSRFFPAALIGLPMVSVLLGTFPAAALQQWRAIRVRAGHDGLLEQLLAPWPVQLLAGMLVLWALLAAWMLVPLALTRRVVTFDEATGALEQRTGLRRTGRARIEDVVYAVGEPERGGTALIGLRAGDPDASATSADDDPVVWAVPHIGWDDASFDGLRVLQGAAGLNPAPPRLLLLAQARAARLRQVDRELARRLDMPWRDEYDHDHAAFQREFDRVRRVLGGKEPPTPPGD